MSWNAFWACTKFPYRPDSRCVHPPGMTCCNWCEQIGEDRRIGADELDLLLEIGALASYQDCQRGGWDRVEGKSHCDVMGWPSKGAANDSGACIPCQIQRKIDAYTALHYPLSTLRERCGPGRSRGARVGKRGK